MENKYSTESVRSGDVDIFFRRFGKSGALPLLLFHGGNYYDSYDWIEVAEALSQDREVVAFDSRGFGESGWSPSKNYSHGAHMADALRLLDHLGWERAIVVGHSRGGAYAMLFAARFSDRAAGLVIIDYCPGLGIGPRGMPVVESQSIGNRPKIFSDADAALTSTSRFVGPEGSASRERSRRFLQDVDGGVIISRRDPDFANQIPTVTDDLPGVYVGDMWAELLKVHLPTLVFRALKSTAGYTDEDLQRLRRDHPDIEVKKINSGHDVVAEAPEELVRDIKGWLARSGVDARGRSQPQGSRC